MGLGRSHGLDGTYVDSSRAGSVGRQVVQSYGPRDGEGVRVPSGSQPGKALADAEGRQLSSAGDPTGVDSQAGQQGAASAGDSDSARPGGASGAPRGAGADFRK